MGEAESGAGYWKAVVCQAQGQEPDHIAGRDRSGRQVGTGRSAEVRYFDPVITLVPTKTVDARQAWFWRPEWQKGECQAAAEIARGNVSRFESEPASSPTPTSRGGLPHEVQAGQLVLKLGDIEPRSVAWVQEDRSLDRLTDRWQVWRHDRQSHQRKDGQDAARRGAYEPADAVSATNSARITTGTTKCPCVSHPSHTFHGRRLLIHRCGYRPRVPPSTDTSPRQTMREAPVFVSPQACRRPVWAVRDRSGWPSL